ncbi:MAG: hypothetical protein JWQ49_6542 [Edaphobacter sp.]|nr:hypothetical protein [Edaphobacter sp.]
MALTDGIIEHNVDSTVFLYGNIEEIPDVFLRLHIRLHKRRFGAFLSETRSNDLAFFRSSYS